jgi:predicted enzyme related to lactoylglutathione lyase
VFTLTGVTIDCADPHRLAEFWAAVLNRPITAEMGTGDDWATVGSRSDRSPRLNFQRVPEPKTTKVRVHLDLIVENIEQAMDYVTRLGGTWLGTRLEYDEGVVTHMADPEGNEFLPRSVLLIDTGSDK